MLSECLPRNVFLRTWEPSLLNCCHPRKNESACNLGDLGSIPGLGRSPREGKGYPLQYSALKNSMECIVHGVAKGRTQLSNFTSLHFKKDRSPIFQSLWEGESLHNFYKCQLGNTNSLNLNTLDKPTKKVLLYFSTDSPGHLKTLPPFLSVEL